MKRNRKSTSTAIQSPTKKVKLDESKLTNANESTSTNKQSCEFPVEVVCAIIEYLIQTNPLEQKLQVNENTNKSVLRMIGVNKTWMKALYKSMVVAIDADKQITLVDGRKQRGCMFGTCGSITGTKQKQQMKMIQNNNFALIRAVRIFNRGLQSLKSENFGNTCLETLVVKLDFGVNKIEEKDRDPVLRVSQFLSSFKISKIETLERIIIDGRSLTPRIYYNNVLEIGCNEDELEQMRYDVPEKYVFTELTQLEQFKLLEQPTLAKKLMKVCIDNFFSKWTLKNFTIVIVFGRMVVVCFSSIKSFDYYITLMKLSLGCKFGLMDCRHYMWIFNEKDREIANEKLNREVDLVKRCNINLVESLE